MMTVEKYENATKLLKDWFPGVEIRICPMYSPQFAVLATGEIYNLASGVPEMLNLLPVKDKPYKRVSMCGKPWLAHVIVCVTFHGARPTVDGERWEVRHLNGKGDDNRAENLQWAPHVVNEHDKYAHGTRRRRVR